jgi:hypothetical protein
MTTNPHLINPYRMNICAYLTNACTHLMKTCAS